MKRGKRDNAGFDPEAVLAVWGPRPTCVVTCEQSFVDCHHILGRGFDHGARPGDEERAYFGSILNCVPLGQPVHHGPLRDSREMRRLFLRIAEEKVRYAENHGEYEPCEIDEAFRALAGSWMAKNPI